jgi:hypothetical protein
MLMSENKTVHPSANIDPILRCWQHVEVGWAVYVLVYTGRYTLEHVQGRQQLGSNPVHQPWQWTT